MKKEPIILIVDDNPGTCEVLQDVLEEKGYNTVTVNTGKEAISKSKRKFYNIALIDLHLLDMPGVELLKRIKDSSPDTETIAITGYASLPTAIEAIHAHAFAYVQKPLDMEQLLGIIVKALDTQKLRQEKEYLLEKLKKSEEKYRTLFEHAGTAVAIIEEDKMISMVNKQFEELSGYSKEEIEGKLKFVDFIFEYEKQKADNGINPGDYDFVGKNGELRHICLNIQGMPKSKQSIATLNDLTEIKKAERELKARMNELERWHKLTVDRELRMVELKKRIKELETTIKKAK
jgi:PAS domain S-box-containing protein